MIPKSGFPWRLFWRFVSGQIFVMLLILAFAGLSARGLFRGWVVEQAEHQAKATLETLRGDIAGEDLRTWCGMRTAGQLTFSLIQADGQVICSTLPSTDGTVSLNDVEQARKAGFGSQVVSRSGHEPALYSSLAASGGLGFVIRARAPIAGLQQALRFFDGSLAGVLGLLALTFAGFSAWMGRRIMFPLGRLLLKARRVEEQGTSEEEDESRYEDEHGEWTDLESTLDQIRSNLRNKTETLSREREELATLMAAISDAIVAVDPEGNPLFFNSRFALLFGDKELSEKGTRLGEIFRAPEILDAFKRTLTEGLSQNVSARLFIRQDPVPHYFALSVAPLRKDGGQVYGAVGIFHDVTELKRAEQIRIDFVANVSHELRTPLTSIKGYTDTLIEDAKSNRFDAAPQFLETIARNVDRLMALIDDLLDLSSLEGGDAEITKSSVDTRELTNRVLKHIESLRSAKGHHIDTSFEAPVVYAQGDKLEQVLTNLLVNAVKYVPAGGRIQISWDRTAKGVLLRVADNGPGIPPEHQPRLFERFYRIDKARSREMGGTGLGLAIVKHILQSHGGSVYVMSEPGRGAEFVCQFPNGA